MVANKRKQPLDYKLSIDDSQAEVFDHHTDYIGFQLSISYNSPATNLTVLPTQVTIIFSAFYYWFSFPKRLQIVLSLYFGIPGCES